MINYGRYIIIKTKEEFHSRIKNLDYKINDIEGRKELLHSILDTEFIDGVEFPTDLFLNMNEDNKDEVQGSRIKISPNRDEPLYSDSAIAHMLEVCGSYLINAPEVKEQMKDKEGNIKIYHDKELFLRSLQEDELRDNLLTVPESSVGMNIFVQQKNFKKEKRLKLTPALTKQYPILHDYNRFKWELINKEKNMRYKQLTQYELGYKNLCRRQSQELKKDLQLALEHCLRPIVFKAPLRDEGCPDWDALDMMDKNIIKMLLPMHKTDDINNDLNVILMDLDLLINRTSFTDKQRDVLDLYRMGVNLTEIAKILNIKVNSVRERLDGICRSLSKSYYDLYEDWYYLNICKGDYFTCKFCHQVKLTSKLARSKHPILSNMKKCKDCN